MRTYCFLSRVFVVNRRCAWRKIGFLVIFTILLALLCMAMHKFFTRDIELDGWGMNANRNATNYVYPSRDTSFSHVNPNICSEMKPLVVVMICSDTRNSKLRNAIRETWAKDAHKYNILVMFLVGVSLHEDVNMATLKESIQYKDIIAEDVTDAYNNLTIKSIFMLKWVQKKCMQARFLMKADDDTYINLENLYNYTSQIEDHRLDDFLVGNIPQELSPFRFHYSKWYIPRYMYPQDRYPPYVNGVAYLMSTCVAKKLYYESLLHEIVYLEDVYITGICAQNLHITAQDDPLFHFHERPVSLQCNTDRQLIALGHYVDVYRMYRIEYQLQNC